MKIILLSLWLPILVMAVLVGWTGVMWSGDPAGQLLFGVLSFGLGWVIAIPLTWPVFLLHRHSRVTAYLCAAVLIPFSTVALIATGLLLGSAGLIIFATIIPVPAWIVLSVVRRQRGGAMPHCLSTYQCEHILCNAPGAEQFVISKGSDCSDTPDG